MNPRVLFCLAAALLVAPACVPLAPGAVTEESVATPADAGGWQEYRNQDVGFSIQYPPGWRLEEIPQAPSSPMQGVALAGPEGGAELQWGSGFGGVCAAYSALHVAHGQIPVCHTMLEDGSLQWLFLLSLPAATFGGRAFTASDNPADSALVLELLATLSFDALQAQAAPAPETQEIVVDNAGAAFWPGLGWYYLETPEAFGPDCLVAVPGLRATAEVRPDLPQAGLYEVSAWWCGDPFHNQATRGLIELYRSTSDPAPQVVQVNYQAGAGQWQNLGVYALELGAFLTVRSVLGGHAVADAYRFVPAGTAAAEVTPTPMLSPVIVTNHPPSPVEQLTSGDLAARLALVDPFYDSLPTTATEATWDDCAAFPRQGCGGTRAGWDVVVTYESITLAYRVSDDYRMVAIDGAGMALDPWMMGQDHPQRVFLRGSTQSGGYSVHYQPDNAWRVLRYRNDSTEGSDEPLAPEHADLLRALASRYSTLFVPTEARPMLTFYGLGTVTAPDETDGAALQALAAALAAGQP